MYICKKTTEKINFDGKLEDNVWKNIEKSPRFIDVIGGTPALYDTKAALTWDDQYLYVGMWCEEPFPEATLTQRDDYLWFENDYEIFIDGGDTYYELQVSAINNIYEVFYIWQDAYQKNPTFRQAPEFDVFKNNARVFGGNHDRTNEYFWKGSHPRGNRWAFLNWDMPGLKTSVYVDGKVNDPSTVSKEVRILFAFPWAGMKWLQNGKISPPKEGDVWRIFIGRYQKLKMNGREESVGWAWDKIGTNDNHYPEKFTQIKFSH
ncbi:MAG: carbohydrate-binding family 9-like protein [Brevinema sp.]